MRSAPPAACDVALDATLAVGLALILLLAAGSVVHCLASQLGAGAAPLWAGLLALVWPLSRLLLARSRASARRLVWDGQDWRLLVQTGSAEAGRPLLTLDAGTCVLVRWQSAEQGLRAWQRTKCLPLVRSGSHSSADWHALRCALIWAAA